MSTASSTKSELIFNSDIWFRRSYLPDDSTLSVPPVAEIEHVNTSILSIAANDVLTVVGSAQASARTARSRRSWTLDSLTLRWSLS